jgi:regulator of sigma E protease
VNLFDLLTAGTGNLLGFLVAFVPLLGILIFVHELGHFAVAKWCGVRVLKFSLGFGPAIGFGRFRLRWERNGTEYVVAWFPLGGFVKMLGENPDEQDAPEVLADCAHTLGARPVWQKLSIVFAGPAMNLLLPVVVFVGALAVGMPRADAVIGTVEPGSPAAAAGLAVGDRVLAVDGAPTRFWDDVEDAVRAKGEGDVALEIERAGERRSLHARAERRQSLDDFGGVTQVGSLGLGHPRLRALLGVPGHESPAAAAGLRSGDHVIEVGGAPVEDWVGFAAAYAGAGAQGSVALRVERGEQEPLEVVEVPVPATGSVAALGVVPANVLIARVEVDSPAHRAGLAPGDLILAVDGAPVGSFAAFAEIVRTSKGRELEITYARKGETTSLRVSAELRSHDTGLGIDEERYRIGIEAQGASAPGAVATDREVNPLIAVPRAVGMTVEMTQGFLRGFAKLVTGEVPRNQIAGPIGIAVIARNALRRGWEAYLTMLVLISINLGVLNLLPIPVLDGGQALVFAIEGIKRSPVSLRTREIAQQIGVTVLVLLMGFAFWNDLSRVWTKVLEMVRGTG